MPNDKTCGNCHYGCKKKKRLCKRWPPTATPSNVLGRALTRYPVVQDDDWCGEWMGKRGR
jgi:hypothetical protein